MAFEIIDCNTIFGPWPIVRADMSVDKLIGAMTKHGVSKALTVSTFGILHTHGDGNQETHRVCSQRPELLPVATLDPRGYFGTPGLIAKLAEAGFKMIRFFPHHQQWELSHSAFQDALDEIEKTGLPVMLESGDTGYPTALATHFAGRKNLFILEGVKYENMAETVSVMRKHENIMVETHELRVPGSLKFLVDQIGAERAVFGSGSMVSSMASALAYILSSELTDEHKEKILGANIKRILGG